jgi:hypothetical protein
MVRRRTNPPFVCLVLCVWGTFTLGCSGLGARHPQAAANSSSEQNLPFHSNQEHATDDKAHPAIPADRKSGSDAPFLAAQNTRSLPAGTLITVRLNNALSILDARPGDTFAASVSGLLTSDGEVLAGPGTAVRGRVEAAQPSIIRPGYKPDPGYVRLTLNNIEVNGRLVDLQTSSLFAKGTLAKSLSPSAASSAKSNELRLQKGRRLTFRVIAPVNIPDLSAVASQVVNPSSTR